MSVFTRSEGQHGYKTSLDVTAVHLGRICSIVEKWPEPVPRVRFGGSHYESDLAEAARRCGLNWDPERSERLFDRSCVHHTPATIAHLAQRLYDSLCGGDGLSISPSSNLAILEADALAREGHVPRAYCDVPGPISMAFGSSSPRPSIASRPSRKPGIRPRRQLQQTQEQLQQTQGQLQQTQAKLQQTQEQLQQTQGQLRHSQEQLRHSQEQLRHSQEQVRQTQEQVRQTQEQVRQTQEQVRQTQEQVRQTQHRYEETQTLLTLTHRSWQETEERLRQTSEELDAALARGDHLQARLDRYEVHPLLGPALRGRRRLVRVFDSLRTREVG